MVYHSEEVLILYNQLYMLPFILFDHSKICIGQRVIVVQQLKVGSKLSPIAQCSRCRVTGDLEEVKYVTTAFVVPED